MKFFFYIIITIFFFKVGFSEENNLKYIDLNYIINNSIIGKDIINSLNKKNEKLIEEYKLIEIKLEAQKNEILSKQNILEKKDFDKKVFKHENNVKEYQIKRQNDLNILNNEKKDLTSQLLKLIDKILIDYSKNNNIDLIIKKESLIVSNSKLDITNIILENLNANYKKLNK